MISESVVKKRLTFISSQAINWLLVVSSICCLKYENLLNTGMNVFIFLQQIGRGGDNSIMKGAECLWLIHSWSIERFFFAFLVMRVRSRVGRGFAQRNMFCLGWTRWCVTCMVNHVLAFFFFLELRFIELFFVVTFFLNLTEYYRKCKYFCFGSCVQLK